MSLSKKKQKVIDEAIHISYAPQSDHDVNGMGILETLMDASAMSPGAAMEEADDLEWVLQLIGKLDFREATILRLRFGFGGREPKSLRQIGEFLGLTRERIRQIEGEALAKLEVDIQALS